MEEVNYNMGNIQGGIRIMEVVNCNMGYAFLLSCSPYYVFMYHMHQFYVCCGLSFSRRVMFTPNHTPLMSCVINFFCFC